REGATVVVAELNEEVGAATAEQLSHLGPTCFVHTDVSDEASAEACVRTAVDRFGRIDVVVNNAGLYGDMDMSDNSLEYLRKMVDINVNGSWLMARAAAIPMSRHGGGR